MRTEWGEDEGLKSAHRHRERLVKALQTVRAAIDRFAPDFILIWGDDQYENFREDIIPPFCVYLYDKIIAQPFLRESAFTQGRSVSNVWGEPADKTWTIRGHQRAASYLVSRLIEHGFDVSYALKPLHYEGLSHAFTNTLLYLDYDRKGFDYPIVPFTVNCYGKDLLTAARGYTRKMIEKGNNAEVPPGPTPRRYFDLGVSVCQILEASPWRIVIMASSSWSHAFLTPRNGWIYPDIDSDRRRYENLKAGQHARWRELSNDEIEAAGEYEFRNWICLAGAMADRQAEVIDYVETYIFNSNKCLAIFK